MTTQNGRVAPFAHFLGLAPRKPKAAPKPPKAARTSPPKPKVAASAAPKARLKIRASDFSHLLTDMPPAAHVDRPTLAASPAEQAIHAYRRATGQTAAAKQRPKPGSAAERAVALYRRLKGV